MIEHEPNPTFLIYADELNALQILGSAHGAAIRKKRQQEIVESVRARIPTMNPCSDMILTLVKKHLDEVIKGDLPIGCGGGISTYCAIRVYIENMEKHPWICEQQGDKV
jgi:hypothetical protein